MPELPLHDQLIDAVVAGLDGDHKRKLTPKLKGLKPADREAFADSILNGAPLTSFGNLTPKELTVVTGLAAPALNQLTGSGGATETPRRPAQSSWVVDLHGARSALRALPHPQASSFADHLGSIEATARTQVIALTKGHGQVDTGVRKAMGGAQKLIVECLRGFVS